MYAPPVVFCERTGQWAAAWRRLWSRRALQGNHRPPRLLEARSATECRELAAANRGSFVVAELAPLGAEQTLDLLFDLLLDQGCEFQGAASAVTASRQMLGYERLARELGALAFVVSPLGLDGLCRLVERHASRSIVEAADVRQRIWERLPWS